ncbi:histone RNA hairpin-binding protein RNA-binding domain-containing protein [Phlyctochytrium arcticum]|nr:histone RNA hairpin-binding protein RNA-binding domain-containing protein [Phlyctochytrium arcticum]
MSDDHHSVSTSSQPAADDLPATTTTSGSLLQDHSIATADSDSVTHSEKKSFNVNAPTYVPVKQQQPRQRGEPGSSRGINGRSHRGQHPDARGSYSVGRSRGGGRYHRQPHHQNSHAAAGDVYYAQGHPRHSFHTGPRMPTWPQPTMYYPDGGSVAAYAPMDPQMYTGAASYPPSRDTDGISPNGLHCPSPSHRTHSLISQDAYEHSLSSDMEQMCFDPDQADSVTESAGYNDGNSFVGSLMTQASRVTSYTNHSGSHSSGSLGSDSVNSTDERRLEQRQKQIDYGKNTVGYKRYIAMVPKHKRKRGDPETPKKHAKCSKRCWDGLIRHWRRKLHEWDPPEQQQKKKDFESALAHELADSAPSRLVDVGPNGREFSNSDYHMSNSYPPPPGPATPMSNRTAPLHNTTPPTPAVADWSFSPVIAREQSRVRPTPLTPLIDHTVSHTVSPATLNNSPQSLSGAVRNLGFGSSTLAPPLPVDENNPIRQIWGHSIDELDEKFASRLRPWETFEGFGPSLKRKYASVPPQSEPLDQSPVAPREDGVPWAARFTIDELDEKFGHKLRISESVDMVSPFSRITDQSHSPFQPSPPFTPSPRSKLAPIGRPTPPGRQQQQQNNMTTPSKYDVLGPSPIGRCEHFRYFVDFHQSSRHTDSLFSA